MMRAGCLLLFVPLIGLSQDQTSSAEALERAERAHQKLYKPDPGKSKTAAALTEQAADLRPGSARKSAFIPRRNFIDAHIFGRMEEDGIPHAGLASDAEFVRRAYLDATGRIPPVDKLLAFIEDQDPEKRSKLIDQLIDSEEFIDRWSYYFEDLFRAGNRMGFGKNLFHYWIEEWLRLDRSYADVATDLLTGASKSSFSHPGALYFARDFVKAKDDPEEPDAHDLVNVPDSVDEFTITYSRVLLGINLGCISCHDGKDHLEGVNLFLSGKTRVDFYQQAAFFGRTRMLMNWENGFQANTEYTVDDVLPGYDTEATSIVRIPKFGGNGDPEFILTDERPKPGKHQRDELARMLTGHIQFARVFTNRIWSEFMGFGIVEPVEEFDLVRYNSEEPLPGSWTRQPSNPELLDAMARDFQNNDFSFKHVVRTIMKSSAYQLSSKFEGEWKQEYTPYHGRKYVRMLSAPELHDVIALATSRPGSFGSGTAKARMVMELMDPAGVDRDVAEFLRAFGQASRDEMPKKGPSSSLQAMLLMNSKVILDRVLAEGNSRVEQLVKARYTDRLLVAQLHREHTGRELTPDELESTLDRFLVERIYLATLARQPTEPEREIAKAAVRADPTRGAQNLQWALINSPEFVFNY